MDSEEGQGGAGDEYAQLIDCLESKSGSVQDRAMRCARWKQSLLTYCVCGVEGSKMAEWRRPEGEK